MPDNINQTPDLTKVDNAADEIISGNTEVDKAIEQNIPMPTSDVDAMIQYDSVNPLIEEEYKHIDKIRQKIAGDFDFEKYITSSNKKSSRLAQELGGLSQAQDENLYTIRPEDMFEQIGGKQISRYPTFIEGTDNEDRLSRQQSNWEKAGRGITKFLAGTGATILGTTVGSVTGIANAISEGDFDAVTSDSFNEALFEWQQRLEHQLPNYVSAKERDMNFIQKLGTANMWLDEIPQGMSYIAGFIAGEAIWGAATLGAGSAIPALRLAKQFRNLNKIKDFKAGKLIHQKMLKEGITKGQMRSINALKRGTETLNATRYIWTSSGYDAGTEVRQFEQTAREEFYQYYRDTHGRNPNGREIMEFREDIEGARRKVFWSNMFTVGLTNMALYGKIFNIKNPLSKVGKNFENRVFGRGFREGSTGRIERRTSNRLQRISDWSYTNMIRPAAYQGGWEAAGQHNIRETAAEWVQAGYNEEYTREQADIINSILSNIGETYTTKEGWNSIGQGMLIGMLGRTTHLGQGSPNRIRRAEEAYEGMLKGTYSAEKLMDNIKTLNRVRAANERFEEAQASGNATGMKFAEDSSMLSVIANHHKYDNLELFRKDLEAFFEVSSNQEVADMLGVEENQINQKKEEFLENFDKLSREYKRAREFSENIIGRSQLPKKYEASKADLADSMAYTLTMGRNSGENLTRSIENLKDTFKGVDSEFRSLLESSLEAHEIMQLSNKAQKEQLQHIINEKERTEKEIEKVQNELIEEAPKGRESREATEQRQPERESIINRGNKALKRLEKLQENLEQLEVQSRVLEAEILTSKTPYAEGQTELTNESHLDLFKTTKIGDSYVLTSLEPLIDYMEGIKDSNPQLYETMKVRLNDVRLALNAHKYYNNLVQGIGHPDFNIPQFATKLGYSLFGNKDVNEFTNDWIIRTLADRSATTADVEKLMREIRPNAPKLTYTDSDLGMMNRQEIELLREEIQDEVEINPEQLDETSIEELRSDLEAIDEYMNGVSESESSPTLVTEETVAAIREVREKAKEDIKKIEEFDPNKERNDELDKQINEEKDKLDKIQKELDTEIEKVVQEKNKENEDIQEEIDNLQKEKRSIEKRIEGLEKGKVLFEEAQKQSPEVAGYSVNFSENSAITPQGDKIKAKTLKELKEKLKENIESTRDQRIISMLNEESLTESEVIKSLNEEKYIDPTTGIKYTRNKIDQENDFKVIRGEGKPHKILVAWTTDVNGNQVPVEYSVRYKVVSAKNLQASHDYSGTNKKHFISKGQPKDRNIKNSSAQVESIANNVKAERLLRDTGDPYDGPPVVNTRNEVGQGNGRTWGIKEGYKRNGRDYEYREELLKDENLKEKGLLGRKSEIEQMDDPVLVRELVVENPSERNSLNMRNDDSTIIELGQFTALDKEAGENRLIDPVRLAARFQTSPNEAVLSKRQTTLKEIVDLLTDPSNDQDKTLYGLLKDNRESITKKLLDDRTGLINKSEFLSSTDEKGALTNEGLRKIEDTIKEILFVNAPSTIKQAFEGLKESQKRTILTLIPSLISVERNKSLIPQLQQAIIMVHEANIAKVNEFDLYANQVVVGEGIAKERFTEAAVEVARDIFKTGNRASLRKKFNTYKAEIEGGGIFELEGLTKAQAIKKVFGIEYTKDDIRKETSFEESSMEETRDRAEKAVDQEIIELKKEIDGIRKPAEDTESIEEQISTEKENLQAVEEQIEGNQERIEENNNLDRGGENRFQKEYKEIQDQKRVAEEEYINTATQLALQKTEELTEAQKTEKNNQIREIQNKEKSDIEKIKRGEKVDNEAANIIMDIANHIKNNPAVIYYIEGETEGGSFETVERAVPENLVEKTDRLNELYEITLKGEEFTEQEQTEFDNLVEEFSRYTVLEGSVIGESTIAELLERYNQLKTEPVTSKPVFDNTSAVQVTNSTNKVVTARRNDPTAGQFPEGVWLKRVNRDRYELSHMTVNALNSSLTEPASQILIKEPGETEFKPLQGLTENQQKTEGNMFRFVLSDGSEYTFAIGPHSRMIFNQSTWENLIVNNSNIIAPENNVDPGINSHIPLYVVGEDGTSATRMETEFTITNERGDGKEIATNEEALNTKEVYFAVDMADTYNRELIEEYNNSEQTPEDQKKVKDNINIYMMSNDKIVWQTRSGESRSNSTSGRNFDKLRAHAYNEAMQSTENSFIDLKVKANIKSMFSGSPRMNMVITDEGMSVNNLPLDENSANRVVDFGYAQDGKFTLKNNTELEGQSRAYVPAGPERTPVVVFKYGGRNIPVPASITYETNMLPDLVNDIINQDNKRTGTIINELNNALLENGVKPSKYNINENTLNNPPELENFLAQIETEKPSPDPHRWMEENTTTSLTENTMMPFEIGTLGRPKPLIDFENIEGLPSTKEIEGPLPAQEVNINEETREQINKEKEKGCDN